MMNIGIVVPQPGYLQGLRDCARSTASVLIFDEVKCGGTIADGGAIERYGVQPDLACFAKAIGGGARSARSAGEADVMDVITQGRGAAGHVQRQPAVGRRRARGAHRGAHAGRLRAPRQARHDAGRGLRARDRRARHPRPTPSTWARRAASRTGRSRCGTTATSSRPTPSSSAASYPWMVNRGMFMTPGDEEQWTISVQHTEDDIERTSTRSPSSARSSPDRPARPASDRGDRPVSLGDARVHRGDGRAGHRRSSTTPSSASA